MRIIGVRSRVVQTISPIKPPKQEVETINITSTDNLELPKIPQSAYIANSNISFGYSHPIKTIWKKGLLPTVTKGLYGDELTQDNISLEHIIPHSHHGKSRMSNYALASSAKNNLRGDKPLTDFLTKDMAINYLEQFKDVEVNCGYIKRGKEYIFKGNNYIKFLLPTLAKEGVNVAKHFKEL